MLDITQKDLEKKVRGIAKLLGVNDRITEVRIDEAQDTMANVFSVYNMYDKNYIYLKDVEETTIIHELLHVVFKNTSNMMDKVEDTTTRSIMNMIHEQEIEAFAQTLAKLLKGKDE